jgi:hypothetical protein
VVVWLEAEDLAVSTTSWGAVAPGLPARIQGGSAVGGEHDVKCALAPDERGDVDARPGVARDRTGGGDDLLT